MLNADLTVNACAPHSKIFFSKLRSCFVPNNKRQDHTRIILPFVTCGNDHEAHIFVIVIGVRFQVDLSV